MQDDIRASLDDLAIRWETPRGRELKTRILRDVTQNNGEGLSQILKDFMYVKEVPDGRDLRCITLDGEDLTDAKFGKVDLSWCSLEGATLTRADLRSANLKRANLSKANLSLAHLDSADGSRADFSEAILDGTHFKEAKLTGAVFLNVQASRASFDSANLAKTNFCGSVIEQANFFNADCNNANFDSGALEKTAARPAKAWGVRYDMERDEFERQVGLKAITSRTTKRFKGLEALLKATSMMDAAKKGAEGDGAAAGAPTGQGGMFFGTTAPGTRRLKPIDDDMQELESRIQNTRAAAPPSGPAGAPPAGAPPASGPAGAPTRRRPPPPRPPVPGRRPGPGGPGGPGGAPGGQPGSGPQAGRPPRPTGPQPVRRPPPPPAPKLPIAAFDPEAPEPATDWAKAIGQLMQMKGSITKIVIEVGDKSRILYKKD